MIIKALDTNNTLDMQIYGNILDVNIRHDLNLLKIARTAARPAPRCQNRSVTFSSATESGVVSPAEG